ncbi:MAG: homocysteine S-methyltransferase family protein [Bacteroidota bacterium]|nr:homocysteine S-methyltransferase family protein [Bacteroidota bacterium]
MLGKKSYRVIPHVPVLLDGAWGTEFQKRGLAPGRSPELWNLERPETVEEVASAYIEAGSEIILTNTFGGNAIALMRHGVGDRVREINRAGAELSRRAAGARARVFGCMGPTGALLAAREISPAAAECAFAEQADVLAESSVDGIVIETMTDLEEALAALRAARRTGLPIAVTMVFDSGPSGLHTVMGVGVAEAARKLADEGADIVGMNCGVGIAEAVRVTLAFRTAVSLPVWVKPNAGLPVLRDGEIVYPSTAEEFASHARSLVEAGASYIGGCCGTTPAYITALKKTFTR